MNYVLGIDMSHNNGAVNWAKLKATGKCGFAVLRISHGTTPDTQFSANLAACKTLKIPYGFYVYAEAGNAAGAQAEARYALSKISGTSPLFVAYDAEDSALAANSKNTTTDIANAFLSPVKAAGYTPYVYCNETWRQNEIDVQFLKNKGYGFWYARYSGAALGSYANMCDVWQYSCTGKLAGNASQYIDLDVCYNSALLAKIKGTTASTAIWCDTTNDFTKKIGDVYQFASRPTKVTCGQGKVFQELSCTKSGNTFYTKFKAIGRGSAGFYVNGVRQCVGTVK